VKNSAIGWVPPQSVVNILEHATTMYDQGANQPGTLIFAGVWLEKDHMNETVSKSYDLSSTLSKSYWPWVGTATVTVRDKNGNGVAGAVVAVVWGGTAAAAGGAASGTHVTRKITGKDGTMDFSGWVGKATPVAHTVEVTTTEGNGADSVVVRKSVQLKGEGHVSLDITLP